MRMASPWEMDRARVVWWVLAFGLAAAMGFVVYSFVGTFVFGVFIYYATRPVYRKLKTHIKPPSLAAVVALFVLALPAILLLAYTVAVGLQELNGFAATVDLGRYQAILKPYIDISKVVQNPESFLAEPNARAALQELLKQGVNYLGFFGSAALHLFVMIGIAFYLLRDDERLAAWFHRRFDDRNGVVQTYARQVDRDFHNVFFGNILNAFLTAVIGAIAYNALAVVAPPGVTIPYPTLLGLLTGVASLVPVVGIKLVYVPVAAYLTYAAAVVDSRLLWFPVAFVAISFVIVDVIPDLVLRPYVSGRGLHLGMVMFAYIFGPLLFGWYGIFLGPMLLVFVVHFTRLVLPELLAGRPIEPERIGEELWTAEERVDETGEGEPPETTTAETGAPRDADDDTEATT